MNNTKDDHVVPTKNGRVCRQTTNINIKALPAIPRKNLAQQEHLLFNEIEACHVTKKLKLNDGSAEITEKEVVDAVVRQHKVLNAAFPPADAGIDQITELLKRNHRELKKNHRELKKNHKELREDITKLKNGQKKINRRLTKIERKMTKSDNKTASEDTRSALRSNDKNRSIVLPLNRQGQRYDGLKTVGDVLSATKKTILELEQHYDVDFGGKNQTVPALRTALREFLKDAPSWSSAESSQEEDEEDAENEEGDEEDAENK